MRAIPRAALVLIAALMAAPSGAQAQRRSVHVVRAGETLSELARRYHVSVEALSRSNGLRSSTLRPGDRLRIPGRDGWRHARGRTHRVRPGDTLARIARRFRVSVEDLRAANGLRSDSIREGEVLHVPRAGQSGAALRAELRQGTAPSAEDEAPALEDEALAATRARAEELGLGGVHVAQRLLREPPDPRFVEAAGDVEGLSGTLRLPVEGVYLRGWGSGTEGYHLAIDVGAPTGTDVHAAERGLVAYAGNGIRGYGNIVVLVHANGWVTAYAHNHQNAVIAGQIVERGERIGTVGQTGFARGPHLHMMLVYDGRHCDPTPLFTPRVRRANGDEPDEPTVVWDGERQPSGVRCLERRERPHPHYRNGRRQRLRGRR